MPFFNTVKGMFGSAPAKRRCPPPRFEPLEERCLFSFQITNLGSLGGLNSRAFGLNAGGLVVGQSDTPSQGPHAFVSDGTTMRDLGTLAGRLGSSSAFGINDNGLVVGSSCVALPCDGRTPVHAFFWDSDLGMHDLGTLHGGRDSEARAVNNIGEVVGVSSTAQGTLHAFRYIDLTFLDLGTLGGRNSAAYGINDDGVIVGSSQVAPGHGRSPTHAFLFGEGGRLQDLGTLDGGTTSQAFAINNRGEAVGVSDLPNSLGHAVLWNSKGIQDLGTLGGSGSVALGIDDSDQIVGWSQTKDGSQHAFLYTDQMYDLNDLVPPDFGGPLLSATAVNGNIVGFGLLLAPRPVIRAFLITQTDTAPASRSARFEVSAVMAGGETKAAPTLFAPAALPAPDQRVNGGAADDFRSPVVYTAAVNTGVVNRYQGETSTLELGLAVFAPVVPDPAIL
jgi:probable HAF family extracellular repeat protein